MSTAASGATSGPWSPSPRSRQIIASAVRVSTAGAGAVSVAGGAGGSPTRRRQLGGVTTTGVLTIVGAGHAR